MSNFKAINYNGNSKKVTQLNKLQINSKDFVQKKIGISNKVIASFLNINDYKDQIVENTEEADSKFFNSLAIKTEFPLIKTNKVIDEILTPTTFIKYTNGSMEDISDKQQILQVKDVFSINRISSNDNIDTGASLGYGLDYRINKKNLDNKIFLSNSFFIGQVINHKKNSNKPDSSSLNEKKSNFVGKYEFNFDNNNESKNILDNFDLSYNFNLSDDLNKILRNQLDANFKNNNNNFNVSYYETHDIDNSQYIEGKYLRKFNENFNFLIGGRKNLETSRSDNNFLEINYESDCLKLGFNLSKKFYNEDDIKSTNSLTFFVVLKPFGQPLAPDLTSLVNAN